MLDQRLLTLRVLHAEGTVTAAAEARYLSPSAVSQQLRSLSEEIGLPLLEPDGRRVRLTAAALTLIRHAEILGARWEEAAADLDAHRKGDAGSLRITAVATALAAIAAPATDRLRDRYPQLSCHLSEDPAEDRYRLLLSGRTDIAVVIPTADAPPSDDRRFEQRLLLEEPQDLLVPMDHPLARRPCGVMLADVAHESWIQAGDTTDQHLLAMSAASAAGFTPRVRHSALDWGAVSALVAHGHGVCLIPRLAPLPAGLPVCRVPLTGPVVPTRRLVTCLRRGSAGQAVIARGLAALRDAAAEWASRDAGRAG